MSKRKFNDVGEILSPTSYATMQVKEKNILKSNSGHAKRLLPYPFIYQMIMTHSSKTNANDDGWDTVYVRESYYKSSQGN